MSTIERKNNRVYFSFKGEMITKTNKGCFTEKGEKFDGRKVTNFVRGNQRTCMVERNHLKSILMRFFGYDLDFI